MWKQFKKAPGSKEHAWELDIKALHENMWINSHSFLLSKCWKDEVLRIKTRIEKTLFLKDDYDIKTSLWIN